MSGLENNKIFAAVLVAGITAMLSGFIAEQLTAAPHAAEKNAVEIESAETGSSASGGSAPAMPEPILALIAGADVAKGEKIAKACTACHSFGKGDAARVGPNLWNIVGRSKGGQSGFAYSEDLAKLGGAWGYSELNHFLWKPKSYAAGTKMNFIGIKKPEDRAALIAWLRTLADSPAALPSAAQVEKETAELAPPPVPQQ